MPSCSERETAERQTGQMRPRGGSTPSLERQDGFTAAEQRETGVGRGDLREHRVSSGSGHGDSVWALSQSHFTLPGVSRNAIPWVLLLTCFDHCPYIATSVTNKRAWAMREKRRSSCVGRALTLDGDYRTEQRRDSPGCPAPFSGTSTFGTCGHPALHGLQSMWFLDGDDYSPREGWAQDPHWCDEMCL